MLNRVLQFNNELERRRDGRHFSADFYWIFRTLLFFIVLALLRYHASAAAEDGAFQIDKVVSTSEMPQSGCTQPPQHEGDFTIYDRMYVWLDWSGYEAGKVYTYEFFNPEEKLVHRFENSRASNSNGCSWARLRAQQRWENGGGTWTIRFYYDGTLYHEGTFTVEDPGDFDYMSYAPPGFTPGNGLLVAVHGSSYNPVTYFHFFKAMADTNDVALLVPYFDEATWKGYNNVFTRDFRADLHLRKMVDEVARETGADANDLYLYGQSAGGQFVHRYMLAHPEGISRIVISAPGYWTFPIEAWNYPYGLGRTRSLPDEIRHDLVWGNTIEKKVIVGELDIERDEKLLQSGRADLQGLNRLQRASHWVNRMNLYSFERELPPHLRYEIIPEATHNNTRTKSFAQIEVFLFGDYERSPIVGSVQIEDDADAIHMLPVDLQLTCRAAAGCGSAILAAAGDPGALEEIGWSGEPGDVQTASIPYTLPAGEGVKFVFCRFVDRNGATGDLTGDAVFYDSAATAIIDAGREGTPAEFVLQPNYPNPFNPATVITYRLFRTSYVKLSIYNPLGQKIATLVEARQLPRTYQVVWDGRDRTEKWVANGMYLYTLQAGSFAQTRKMSFLK